MIARTEEEFELFQVGARISCYPQLVLRRIHTYCRELRSFNTPYLLKCINVFFSSITTPPVRFNFWQFTVQDLNLTQSCPVFALTVSFKRYCFENVWSLNIAFSVWFYLTKLVTRSYDAKIPLEIESSCESNWNHGQSYFLCFAVCTCKFWLSHRRPHTNSPDLSPYLFIKN